MRHLIRHAWLRQAATLATLAAIAAVGGAAGPASADDGAPFGDGERLRYEIVWPSGLDLGEAEFQANARAGGWEFEAELAALLPNFEVKDRYRSVADAALCSLEFNKEIRHGSKQTKESVVFNQAKHEATRRTIGGGEGEFPIPPCMKDGLTYLYFLRQELALGRIPPPDDVNFGAQYQITVTYAESRDIEVAGEMRPADRLLVDLTGPASQHSIEIFFGHDKARTPLLIRAPFELGTFSLRLKP